MYVLILAYLYPGNMVMDQGVYESVLEYIFIITKELTLINQQMSSLLSFPFPFSDFGRVVMKRLKLI
jgi:hypothetical protein